MPGPFDVLMVDPPWPLGTLRATAKGRQGFGQRVGLGYKTAPLDALWAMMDRDIFSLLTERAVVFLWTVDRFLVSAEQEMEARGYHRHARLIWYKGEQGMIPCGTLRFCHEYLLWFYRPPLAPVAKEAQGKYTTVLQGARREHSRKPESAYRLVEALYPDARRLDAFTREYRENWTGWGWERDHFTPLLAGLREEREG